DDSGSSWHFTSGAGGPMGRITSLRPAGNEGIRITVAVTDVVAITSRAIELGGGTANAVVPPDSDLGDFALLIDPDGNRFAIFHGKLHGHRQGQSRSGAEDAG
ncbi:MAG TPA: hypothetical protein VIO57_05215, partial [Chloroflexota bacterium]